MAASSAVGRAESRVVNADLSAYLEERLSALPDIKANGADDVTMRGLHERLAARFRVDRDALLAASLFSGAANAALVAATVASLATAAWLQQSGAITVGGVYLVFRYTGMLRMPLERLTRHMNSFQRAMGGIVRVRELLATEPRITDGAGADLPAGALAVELDAVDFAYEREPVLRDVSFRRRARSRARPRSAAPDRARRRSPGSCSGSTTSTAAPCASAASTCATCASTTCGGASASSPRTCSCSTGPCATTCGCSTPTWATTGSSRVFASLGLDEWLAELPDGLDTVLGPTARGLSAGEAQLVALARVFLEDPGLVVLDEASSRLDPHTEALLEDAIDRLLAGRTGIVIAHRLRTIERADDGARARRRVGSSSTATGWRSPPTPRSRFAALLRTGLPEVRA